MPNKSQDSWRSLYPFESHYLALEHGRYHFLDEGEGTPLLMVHGNPTWSFYWRQLAMVFRGKHRVIVPDHIGCGLSDKPQRYSYRLEDHINNLVELLRVLELRDVTLMVHDWGGAIGLGAALQEPSRISRLILFNTGAFPPPYIPWRIRACRVPVLGTLAIRGLNLFARAALWMATAQPDRFTPEVRAGFLAPYGSWADRIAIDRFVRDIPFTRWHPTWKLLAEIEAGLPQLADRPTQLIWGMRDWCFRPECLERFIKIFPDAAVCRLYDAGHYVVEDKQKEVVSAVAAFLEWTGSGLGGSTPQTHPAHS